VLGGSEGGLVESYAALLARHGYAALALAYFGIEHPSTCPEASASSSSNTFHRAIAWMSAHAEVAGVRIAVVGSSRGAELALLLGATFPKDAGREPRGDEGYRPARQRPGGAEEAEGIAPEPEGDDRAGHDSRHRRQLRRLAE
jgi:acetyl esterase/lipase